MVASNIQLLENKYTAHYAEFSSRFPGFQAKADPNLQIYSEPIYNEYLRQQQSGILKSKSHLYDIAIDPMKLHDKIHFDPKELHKKIMDEKKNKIIIAPSMPTMIQNNQNIYSKKIEMNLFAQSNSSIQINSQLLAQQPMTSSTQVKIEERQSASKFNDIPERIVPEISQDQSV